MNRKRIGGLILLIILVGIAGVFYLIQRNTDTGPDVVFEPPSDEVIKQIQKDIAERNAQDADKTLAPGEKEETGHWHADGTWHAGASEEENREFYQSYGLELPPPGHTYVQTRDGNIQLIKDNEPFVEIYTQKRFDLGYLSDKDWKIYQALVGITHKHIIRTERIPPEVVALAQERKETLEQKAHGPVPSAKALTIYNRLITPADQEKIDRRIDEKIAEAYTQLGLRRDRTTYHFDYDLIEQLVIEFQNEVNK